MLEHTQLLLMFDIWSPTNLAIANCAPEQVVFQSRTIAKMHTRNQLQSSDHTFSYLGYLGACANVVQVSGATHLSY